MQERTSSLPSTAMAHSWVTHWASKTPSASGLTFENITFTWREIEAKMYSVAKILISRGIKRGDRVACCLPNRPEFLFAFLGVNLIGAIFVPMNHRLTQREISVNEHIVTPTLAITDENTSQLFSVPVLNVDANGFVAAHSEADPQSIDPVSTPDDPVAILFTSGTTSAPKGATFTNNAFYTTAKNSAAALSLTPADAHLVVSPLSFTGGILTSTQPILFTGGHMLLLNGFDQEEIFDVIQKHSPTIFMAVPSMLALLAKHPKFNAGTFSSLRYLGSGSAPAPLPLLEIYRHIGIKIGHAYGLTEGGGLQTLLTAEEVEEHHGTAGKACKHMLVRVVDDGGSPLPTGQVGEIQVKSAACMTGYWNEPDKTAEVLKDGWIATGDLGSIDEAGYLTVRGRAKEVIISGGINVYPAEVENVLSTMDEIEEVAVIGSPSETFGETVTAVIVKRDKNLTDEQVKEHCRKVLADFKIPKIIRFVEAIPRTASGKVQKNAL